MTWSLLPCLQSNFLGNSRRWWHPISNSLPVSRSAHYTLLHPPSLSIKARKPLSNWHPFSGRFELETRCEKSGGGAPHSHGKQCDEEEEEEEEKKKGANINNTGLTIRSGTILCFPILLGKSCRTGMTWCNSEIKVNKTYSQTSWLTLYFRWGNFGAFSARKLGEGKTSLWQSAEITLKAAPMRVSVEFIYIFAWCSFV